MRKRDAEIAVAYAPGSCGELVQGVVGGRHAHITCPIDAYSMAAARVIEEPTVKIFPPAAKAKEAVERLLAARHVELGVELSLATDLPVGKGMASSTADIAAACFAAAEALGIPISALEISEIAVGIEPTDGTLFDGVVLFDHVMGGRAVHLGFLEADIIVLEPSKTLDTLSYGVRRPDYDLNELSALDEAFSMVATGISAGDLGLVGKGAVLSARINQRFLPKPHLDELIERSIAAGAAGINIAHSGTVVGILAEPGTGCEVLEIMRGSMPDEFVPRLHRLAPGGVRVVERATEGVGV